MKFQKLKLKFLSTLITALILISSSSLANIWGNTQQQEIVSCTSSENSRNIPLLGMWLNTYWIALNKGATYQFIAYFAPANATNKKVNWVTNNEQVVKVNQNGVVTAIGPGHALIICTSEDNGIVAVAQVVVNS